MKKLGKGAITTGSGTLLYTVPASMKCDVMDVNICNTSASPITCAIHLVPSGGSADTTNMLFPGSTIPGKTIVQWTGYQTINTGDFIQGIGSAAGLTVNIAGNEMRANV